MVSLFQKLHDDVVQCRLCPRLVHFREKVQPRASFSDETFWRRPVPGFGDPNAWLLIIGLAPSAQGGNRTGRIFTGDPSGKFLFENLYRAGLANQPTSTSADDGLKLLGCYMTAVVKCVPPLNKPLPKEIRNCSCYFNRELELLKGVKAVLALGGIAFKAYKDYLADAGFDVSHLRFQHGAKYEWEGKPSLYASYHPSPQNTQTGKMTSADFIKLLESIHRL